MDASSFLPDSDSVRTDSGTSSVSEAVAISEAIEMSYRFLVMDEEYSNPCIIRHDFLSDGDSFMSIFEMGRSMGESGDSVLMVSGDRDAVFLADRVILMDGYRAKSVEAPAGSPTAHTPCRAPGILCLRTSSTRRAARRSA